MSLNLGMNKAKAAPLTKTATDASDLPTKAETQRAEDDSGWGETAKIIVHALLIALVVRIFFYQPFNIPSGSMKSTLLVGDFLFASKMSYGYSTYSFPQTLDIPFTAISIPLRPQHLFSGRFFATQPKRGDVAVFKVPLDNSTDFIKRVIGLPGDKIQMQEGVLYINGQAVPKRQLSDFVSIPDGDVRRYEETLPNGVKYTALYKDVGGHGDNTKVFEVPDGHYFMMGDNRQNSIDSRFNVGFVPFENFVGRADMLFFSAAIDEPGTCRAIAPWSWPGCVRWRRLLKFIR